MAKFNFKTYKSTATKNAELAFDKMSKRVAPSPFFNDTDNIIKKAVDKYDAAGGLLSVEFKETIDKYLVSNGISNDFDTIKELASDTSLFTGIKLEIPTDYNYKI